MDRDFIVGAAAIALGALLLLSDDVKVASSFLLIATGFWIAVAVVRWRARREEERAEVAAEEEPEVRYLGPPSAERLHLFPVDSRGSAACQRELTRGLSRQPDRNYGSAREL